MNSPHKYTADVYTYAQTVSGHRPAICDICGKPAGDPLHILTLPGCETTDADRETARQLAQAEEMSAELRRPLADISGKARKLEQDSPLFFGTGNNPSLF